MTTTENIWAVYDAMGVPHLERFLDEGANFVDLDLTEDDVLGYAVNAAMCWYGPPLTHKGEDAREVMRLMFFEFVSNLSTSEGEKALTLHEDGRVTMTVSWTPEEVEVDEHKMRHWQWLLMLFVSQELADRFLAAVPDRIRERAMARATSPDTADHAAFLEIVFPDLGVES